MIARQRLLVISAITLLLTHTSLCGPKLHAEEALKDRVDKLVQPYLDNDVVVGMTIGVLHDGREEYFGYGHVKKDEKRVPDGDTIYEIGSASKVFTGLLLADAVERHEVTLDTPAGDLLPSGVKMPVRGDRAITLLDLATHTSGLPRLPDNLKPEDPTNPYADYTVKDLYAFLKGHELGRAPGERNEYSNLGVGLLGHLLALRAHTTYEELLRERITTPLKMTSTTIVLNAEQRARFAAPYHGGGRAATNWDLPTLAGAGAIRSTAADMLRFAAANHKPPGDELGQAIDLAWRVHREPNGQGAFAMGLGWTIARDGSTRWHNGQTGGYHAMFFVSREIKASVILLTNTGTGEVDRLAEDIIRMLAGAKVEPRKFDKTIEVQPAVMRKYVGKYELAPGAIFTVTVEDDKLMVGLTGQQTLRVHARSETEWFYKEVEATLTFKLDDKGKCEAVELFQNGVRQTAKRIE